MADSRPRIAKLPYTINLYTAQEDRVRSIHLPGSINWSFARIAYDGKHIVLARNERIVAFDPTGKVVSWLATLPAGEHDTEWVPFLTGQGCELLLFNGRNTIYRFAIY